MVTGENNETANLKLTGKYPCQRKPENINAYHNEKVKKRVAAITAKDAQRANAFY